MGILSSHKGQLSQISSMLTRATSVASLFSGDKKSCSLLKESWNESRISLVVMGGNSYQRGEYRKMEFRIKHTWDGLPVSHEPVTIGLKSDNAGLLMEVNAPFFNDPPAPLGEPGKPCSRLWDYEVVEAFFLSDRTEQYLEVELCPHGQHLLLLLSGKRRVWKEELPLEFEVTRMKTKWEGKAHLPWHYFPLCTNKFNAFAIHGSGEERKYEALHPVPRHELQEGQKPDFHRLEFFKELNLKGLMGEDWKQPESDIWKSLSN